MPLLYSKIVGEGKPIVILHGFLGMSDNWKTMAGSFVEDGYQVHLIDQRNHGRSFHSEEFDYDVLVTDLYEYLNHYNLDRIILLGHSMGGKTAMLFAVTYPEMVEKLLVADIAPKFYPPHHQKILQGLSSLDFGVIKSRKEADEELAKYIHDWGTRQFLLKNLYWQEKEKLGFRFNLEVLKYKGDDIGEPLPAFAMYDGPVLFLRGDKSEYVMPSDEDLIHNHFPDSKIITISNSGHWLHAENPKEFYEGAIAFIKSE